MGALSPEHRTTYLAMVGPDGWCTHYDTGGRRCRIYADRPAFCQVGNLAALFDIPVEQGEAFAITCCREQIREEYGGRSRVMRRFEHATRQPISRQP
jgi:Fe-S-cluster containining protein